MTYYEELGVPETASREEIRQAYKHLARLVHPDQCSDEATRRLADLQLKRLNGVLEILQDAAERARYDRSLAALAVATADASSPVVQGRTNPAWLLHTTIVAAVLALSLAILLWPPAVPPRRPIVLPIAEPAPAPTARTIAHARKLAKPPVRLLPEPEWEPLPSRSSEWPITLAALPAPEPVVVPEAPPGSASAAPSAHSPELSGDWLYVPAASADSAGYAPEYIELRLRKEGGAIHGRYQARYRVTDRAISPNVAFQFEGQIAPEGGTLPWSGASGAKGEITLRRLPDGGLGVSWEAEDLGKELGLISGSATLIRKVE